MDFAAVRPDRDQTGKQRVARLTKIQKKIISPNLRSDMEMRRSVKEELMGDDWTRSLNMNLRRDCLCMTQRKKKGGVLHFRREAAEKHYVGE